MDIGAGQEWKDSSYWPSCDASPPLGKTAHRGSVLFKDPGVSRRAIQQSEESGEERPCRIPILHCIVKGSNFERCGKQVSRTENGQDPSGELVDLTFYEASAFVEECADPIMGLHLEISLS